MAGTMPLERRVPDFPSGLTLSCAKTVSGTLKSQFQTPFSRTESRARPPAGTSAGCCPRTGVSQRDVQLAASGWAVRAQRLLRWEQSSTASGNRFGPPLVAFGLAQATASLCRRCDRANGKLRDGGPWAGPRCRWGFDPGGGGFAGSSRTEIPSGSITGGHTCLGPRRSGWSQSLTLSGPPVFSRGPRSPMARGLTILW
jgi:hypothetical protein